MVSKDGGYLIVGIIIVVFFFMVVGVVSVFGLFPGVDLSSFFKENWDWIVSVFIAVVAVFVSTFSLLLSAIIISFLSCRISCYRPRRIWL